MTGAFFLRLGTGLSCSLRVEAVPLPIRRTQDFQIDGTCAGTVYFKGSRVISGWLTVPQEESIWRRLVERSETSSTPMRRHELFQVGSIGPGGSQRADPRACDKVIK
jgi:hypothetical protein